MLARLMRVPAGLVTRAWKKTWLGSPRSPRLSRKQIPDYWPDRFSSPGLALRVEAAAPISPEAKARPEARDILEPHACEPLFLQGCAASYLTRAAGPAVPTG